MKLKLQKKSKYQSMQDDALYQMCVFGTAVVSLIFNWIALCGGMLMQKQRICLQSSGDSELLEAAYRKCMQVLNSVGAKNFCSEHFQKMFLVYGAVYPLDLLALVSKRSCRIEKLFEADMCKNLEVKTFLVF